jgi:ATP-grasp domain
MPVTVLLIDTNWWPSSAHVAISLQDAGVRVAAAYPRHGHPLAKTEAVSERFTYSATSPLNSLAMAIRDSSADWVLPCDDRSVSHLHRLYARALADGSAGKPLADLIERSMGSPDAFSIVSSRAALLGTALAENIPVPEISEVVSLEQLRLLAESKRFPWVMKVDGSWGGLGVKVVRGLKDAEDCFQRMRAPLATLPMLKRLIVNRDPFWIESWWRRQSRGVTAQSYIEGRPANCVVFCNKGRVLASIAVEVVAAQGVMGPATTVRIVEGRQMLDAAEALAGRLKLSGFHGLDFMLEEKTGTAYLVELNPRCAMPCHLRLDPGRDLIGSLHAEISGRPANPPPFAISSELVSYFPQAWLANPKSKTLRTGYHDIPFSEPKLLKELLLLPYPDRSFLARTSDRFRKMTMEQRSARSVIFRSTQVLGDAPSPVNPEGQRGEAL